MIVWRGKSLCTEWRYGAGTGSRKIEAAGNVLKWTLGLDSCTLTYIVLEETNRDGQLVEAGNRVKVRGEE